jgi:NitT/TauT family transport system substrate-binding protein
MAQVKLKPAAKILILLAVAGGGYAVWQFGLKKTGAPSQGSTSGTPTASGTQTPGTPTRASRTYKVALSEWPGHMPLVLGNGGLRTAPDSVAAKEGLSLEIVFIEDPIKKNAALQSGDVDFVWQTVDEMPINLQGYKKAGIDTRAFLQLDWSRGGDACVATAEVKKVEDILGRKSAMMMFSPDHTVFEFMINNSRLTPEQVRQVRKDTSFSLDDFTYGRVLFTQGKVDVACLWEPDVSLALKGRAGSHRIFSTSDATELVADVLLSKKKLLDEEPAIAEKVARVWFAGVASAEGDRAAAAKMIASVVPRFKNELGEAGTLKAFEWVKWTDVADNARFFGLDGSQAAMDRVYTQAENIWMNYPQAEISDRFAPAALRHDAAVRKSWEEKGRTTEVKAEPVYSKEVAESGTPVFTKPVTINFASGAAELDAESIHILNAQVLPQLEMAKAMHVRVEGNTDAVGDKKKNQALSEARAKAVVDFLVSRGLVADRISYKGNGDALPLASNKTSDGRAQNRRTDLLFIHGTTAAKE